MSLPPSPPTRPTLAFVGAGRVGGALALAAHRAGYTVAGIYTRTPARARPIQEVTGARLLPDLASLVDVAGLVFLAVPDDAIAEVDAAGAAFWRPGQGVVHHSGLHSASLLRHAAAAGALPGALHPLQTITDPEAALRLLPGSYFGLSGYPDLLPTLRDFVLALGGRPLLVPDESKALYHAAAVFASNYIVTCFAQAVDLLAGLGIPATDAAQALLPLTQGAISNLAGSGLPYALTGPISRGDAGTVAAHLQQLASARPDLLSLYKLLGLATVPIAAAQGRLSPAAMTALTSLFTPATLSGD